MQNKNLLRRLKRRDESALKELIEQYSAYVVTIIRNVGRNALSESDIEELASDVFIALWNHADKVYDGSLKAYLGVTARNMTISRLRQVHFTIPIDEVELKSDKDIENEIESQMLLESIRDILDNMEFDDREILFRFYFYCQHIEEIAYEMNITKSAAKTRLHRARKKLLNKLLERGYRYED